MKLYPLVDISAYHHFSSSDVLEICATSDLSKPLFIIKVKPLNNLLNLVFYTNASDKDEAVVCTVDQSMYKLSDNYKIELAYTLKGYALKESYYLSDFAQIIRSGHFSIIDQNNLGTKSPNSFSKLGTFLKSLFKRNQS